MKTTIFRAKFIKLMCSGIGPAIVNRVIMVIEEHSDGEVIERFFINEAPIPVDTVNRNLSEIMRRLGNCVSQHEYTLQPKSK